MYVESVSLTDFRCFEKAETTFVYPEIKGLPKDALKNVTLLIGINGAGKTSLLKAVALGLLGPVIGQSGYTPRHLMRRPRLNDSVVKEAVIECNANGNEAYFTTGQLVIKLYLSRIRDTEYFNKFSWLEKDKGIVQAISHPRYPGFPSIDLTSKANADRLLGSLYEELSPEYFILAYGATRRIINVQDFNYSPSRQRHFRFERVAGIFDELLTLYPIAAWFPLVSIKSRAAEIVNTINSLLPPSTRFLGVCVEGDALFEQNGIDLPLGALSDGFRSYIGLIADMLYHMHTVSPKKKLVDLAGVVMIDDIDVHLHPGWQREIVPKLATTFPKLQFIITTHSPLVVGTVHAANIRVVEDNEIHQSTEEADGRSADQILMSSYFGHISPRSPAKEKKLTRIAKRVADTHDPKAAIAFLKELTGKTNGKK
jgi:predicted ATPase